MFFSLKTKLIFFVVLIMFATAAAVMYATRQDVFHTILEKEEAAAVKMLRLVERNIEEEYARWLLDKKDTILKRKDQLKNMADQTISMLDEYADLVDARLISKKFAVAKILSWVRRFSTQENPLFVIDKKGMVVAHPDSAIQGTSISEFRDGEGRKVLDMSRRTIAEVIESVEPAGKFTVLPMTGSQNTVESKNLIYFVPFSKWAWTVGAAIDIPDIEAEAEKKRGRLIAAIQHTLEDVKIAETGSVYFFDGEKNVYMTPHGLAPDQVTTLINSRTGNLLLADFITAAQSDTGPGEISIEYVLPGGEVRQSKGFICYFKGFDWYIVASMPVKEIEKPGRQLITRQSVIIGAIFLGSIFPAFFLVTRISRPLKQLAAHARELSQTDFSEEGSACCPMNLRSARLQDEVSRLAESFDFMQTALRKNVRHLIETTAVKERIESELKIAHDIQMGILPKVFPPFPDQTEFDIYAILAPAREVGGDLYDFFFIDETHLCLVIGDVSGKGVPASLFMAITKTLVKMESAQGGPPEAVLERVNTKLALDNPSLMFVTLFCGILNVRTGALCYANGGHNSPYRIPCRGDLHCLASTNGMALGIKPGLSYASKEIVLKPGETLFLYTDGVSEARNRDRRMYTTRRLEAFLKKNRAQSAQGLISTLVAELDNFVQEEPQTDDITLLAIRYTPSTHP